MGDLVDINKEPIHTRKNKLRDILGLNKRHKTVEFGTTATASEVGNGAVQLTSETLLDAFMLLYDEKRSLTYSSDSTASYFHQKYLKIISEVQNIKVKISDFRVGEIIRSGTFGKVLIGKEKSSSSGSYVSIKIINKFQQNISKFLPLIDAELNILSKASSNWITSFKYAFQDVDRIYIVTEFVPGGTLQNWISLNNDQMIPEDEVMFYIAELVLALNTIHTLGFAHRNIKPSNILLDKVGHIKLADFDSAVRLNSQGNVISPSYSIEFESQRYVAPEVLQSQEDDVKTQDNFLSYGAGCDYWSLGVIAYELAFAKSPFLGESSIQTFNKIVSFKETLHIPAIDSVSKEFQSFIKEIFTDESTRIGYSECLHHPAFYNIIWDTIRTDVPPYIPKTLDEKALSKCILNDQSGEATQGPKCHQDQVQFVGFTKTLTQGHSVSFHLNPAFNNSSITESPDDSFNEEKLAELKTDLQAKNELLALRNCTIESLEKKLADSGNLVSTKEAEILSLSTEARKAKSEVSKFEKKYLDEKTVRENLEARSVELISSIKSAHEKKEAELEGKLAYQSSLAVDKDNHICDLEQTIQELRNKLATVQGELHKAQSSTGEVKQNAARSYRGSISMMESRLLQTSSHLESQLSEMSRKHEEELGALLSVIRQKDEERERKFVEWEKEREELEGRLQESRVSREETLEELRALRKECHGRISELERALGEAEERGRELERGSRDSSLASSATAQEHILNELEETRRERNRLDLEMKQIARESEIRLEKINDLSSIVDKLEKSRQSIEKQNNELLENLNKLVEKGSSSEFEKGASQVLQTQLERCQTALDEAKETIIHLKSEGAKAEELNSKLHDEINGLKLDLRLSIREKREIDANATKTQSRMEELERKLSEAEEREREGEKRRGELEMDMMQLSRKVEGDEFELKEMKRILTQKNSSISKHETDLAKANEELKTLKLQISELSELKASMDDKDVLVKEKTKALQEKERKIGVLATNIEVLKQALNVLEGQLKDFEHVLSEKNSQISEIVETRTKLETENSKIKDDLRKARCEINEAKSLRVFVENRLTEVERSLGQQESSREKLIASLQEEIGTLTDRNYDLMTERNRLSELLEESEMAKENTERAKEELSRQVGLLQTDSSRTIKLYSKLINNNAELKSELEEVKKKCEAYEIQIEKMTEDLVNLEYEKNENKLKLNSMLQQQVKLIEYLQNQNEVLSTKKKRTFADRIFGHKETTTATPQLPKATSTPLAGLGSISSGGTETPLSVLRELNVVRNLEVEASKRRNELANLLKHKETESHGIEKEAPVRNKEEEIKGTPAGISTSSLVKGRSEYGEGDEGDMSSGESFDRDEYEAQRERYLLEKRQRTSRVQFLEDTDTDEN